jgi:prevent-host-death family protein
MLTIESALARTQFSHLLDRVLHGETITITRGGIPVALLVPFTRTRPILNHQEIVSGMRELRKRVKPDAMTAREMVLEERRSQ